MKHPALLSLILLTVFSCSQAAGPDRHTRQLLSELDGYLSAREMYRAKKTHQLEALSDLARETQEKDRAYDVSMIIADEYFAFSFDSTQLYLKRCIGLAEGDAERKNAAAIRLGHLYTKSGNYMEAHQVLYDQIDTSTLSEDLKTEYLLALYDFSRDLSGNSGMVERLSIPPYGPYRDRLLSRFPEDSEEWRVLKRDIFMDQQNLPAADSISRLLLKDLKPEERNYAIHAYWRSEIAYAWGNADDRLTWLVRSAEGDVVNAVRDYASLTLVAAHILPEDVEHAFRYLRIAQEDALLYNAKLRPWQISRLLMDVEDAYMAKQERQARLLFIAMWLMAVLALVLSALTWFLVNRSRKLSRVRTELENANNRLEAANITLNDLNRQISHASKVKEEYIVSFLEDLSDQITLFRAEDNRYRNLLKQGKAGEMLKELSINSRSEKAREKFYETFDRTFLGMYPHFVEQFNSLLREDARLYPPKGRLNTELRIFALIRLGVDDSKRIATMLDYSVSTIYNYKVSVKNSALGDRDSFETAVKNLEK